MLKYLLSAILVAGLAACARDAAFVDDGGLTADSEQPVEFTFALPDAATRSVENPKTQFTEGDVIHIEGTFTMKDGTETIRYGAMSFTNQGAWKSVEGSELRWPNLAASGQFTAYYVATQADEESGGLLQPGGAAVQVRLDALKTNGDPLKAVSAADIGYGHAVMLRFNHLCAYLTLNYLEPMVASNYWFTRRPSDDPEFNNAFRLYLTAEKKLVFEFCQDADSHYPQLGGSGNGLVYIESSVSNFKGENNSVGARTTYFLEPGLYEDFSLVYRNSETEYTEYLQYDYNKIPDVDGHDKTEPRFEAGVPYVLEINKSAGVTMISPSDDNESWHDSNTYYDVDVEEFLRAVNGHKDYYYENVHILEATATGTKLLENVDFKFEKYDIFKGDFKPNVPAGTFDGGNHYIANLGCPLFYENYGTIENLGIKCIDTTKDQAEPYLVSEEEAVSRWTGSTYDLSRTGGLCRFNMVTGVIRNVRISGGVKLVVHVKSKKEGSKDDGGNTEGTEAHNVGGVAGSNVGTIGNVELAGTIEVEVSNHSETKQDLFVQLNVGGIVGQNGANGQLSSVVPYEEGLQVKVTNRCAGDLAAFYMGGIVGSNSGYISDIIVPGLNLDSTESVGLTAYIGGVAGDLSAASPTDGNYSANVTSCTVSGEIRGGNVKPKGDLTCAILAGGLAGATLHTPVTDCQTAVSVYNTKVQLQNGDGIVCATGGAFGRIRKEGNDTPAIRGIIAYGDALQGPATTSDTAYIGNFAGLDHPDMSWNFSDLQIIVKTHAGVADVGGRMQ